MKVLIGVGWVVLVATSASAVASEQVEQVEQVEQTELAAGVRIELITAINGARIEAGLPPMEPDPRLYEIATWRADRVAERSAARSGRGDLTTISRRILSSGYRARAWSEAISLGSADAQAVFDHWRTERPDSFRQTALGDYEHIGVALSTAGELPTWSVIVAASEAGRQSREAAPLKDLASVREQALARVNEERARRGRRPVEVDERLDRAAQAYAEDMLRRGFYDHVDPEGETATERAARAGYPKASFLGENIAKGLFTPQQVVERWLNSSRHRRTILHRTPTETGLGVAVGRTDDGVEVVWVQLFARPSGR